MTEQPENPSEPNTPRKSNDRVNRRPGVRKSWVPTREIPSVKQLETSSTRMLVRGTFGRCPACGAGKNFTRWIHMSDRCHRCTLKFERVEGHWIGFLGTNTVLVFGLMFILLMSVTLLSYPDPPGSWLIWAMVGIAVVGPLVLYKTARMLWTAIDLLMRPLRPGEIDPRYVVNDPYRDNPTGL